MIHIDINKLPKHEMDALARPLIKIVSECLRNPDNQRKYEEWHFKKYGRYPTEASYIKKNKEDMRLCVN